MTHSPHAQGAATPVARGRRDRDGASMVPPSQPRSYYGRPVINRDVWSPEIPAYFFFGGLAGAAGPIAAAARLTGNRALARRASLLALTGAGVSPVLLIADLGRPARFLRMLRVFKPTSPMSVGTWVLSAFGTATGLATGWQLLDVPSRSIGAPAQAVAAVTGPVVSTYTAVLIAQTAVPVWHDARQLLPVVFAGSSLSAAGGVLCAITPPRHAGPVRVLAIGGALAELVSETAMERRLDPRVRRAYEAPSVRPSHLAARACTATGLGLVVAACARRADAGETRVGDALRRVSRARRSGGRTRRSARIAVGPPGAAELAGGLLLCAGSALLRWAIYQAGGVSADDPEATVGRQRDRVDGRRPVTDEDDAAPSGFRAPVPGADEPGPSASGPGMPVAQDDVAPRRGA